MECVGEIAGVLTTHQTRNEFSTSACTVAVLPIGAVEQHGSHLPISTDILLAEAFGRGIAERLDAYLLPAVAISSSIEHRKARGTVYLRAETLAAVVRDIAESLRLSGFTRVVIANCHGGNWVLKPTIRAINRERPEFRVTLVHNELPPAKMAEIFAHPVGDVHAGEFETSLMLHLHPDKVGTPSATPERPFPPQAFLDYFDASELTASGHWGWPKEATAEKGRKAFEALIETAVQTVQQIEALGREIEERARK
ncbi:MAG: creatininase family protein [Verrucomicrobiota bacterium]